MKASDYGQEPASAVGQWGYALDEDGTNGDGLWCNWEATREAAIEAALVQREEDGHDGEFIYIADAIEHEPAFDVDDLIENMALRAYDQCGDAAEDWPSATKEQMAELESAVEKVLADWLTRTKNWPRFCEIGKVEKIPVPPERMQPTV